MAHGAHDGHACLLGGTLPGARPLRPRPCTCWWMMISSDGEAMKADTAPAAAAAPKRSALLSSDSDFCSTMVCMSRFVPNCEAVMGAILTMFICRCMKTPLRSATRLASTWHCCVGGAHRQSTIQVHRVPRHWAPFLQRILDAYKWLHDAHFNASSQSTNHGVLCRGDS